MVFPKVSYTLGIFSCSQAPFVHLSKTSAWCFYSILCFRHVLLQTSPHCAFFYNLLIVFLKDHTLQACTLVARSLLCIFLKHPNGVSNSIIHFRHLLLQPKPLLCIFLKHPNGVSKVPYSLGNYSSRQAPIVRLSKTS